VVQELLGEWESDGYGYDDVEAWVISQAGETAYISFFMGGSDSSAFEDDANGSAAAAIRAFPFQLIVLDRHNVSQASISTLGELGSFPGAVSLLDPVARADLDTFVRSLL
jgi:hypothetical protein